MADTVRAALVCLTLDHGGAEHHLLKLATALRGTRIDPVVVVLDRDARNDLKIWFDAANVPVLFPPYPRNHPGVIKWLMALLRSGDIDVAHSFLWRPDVTLALAATLARFRRTICSERGDRVAGSYWSASWLPRRMLDRALTFRTAEKLVSNSATGVEASVRAGFPRDKTQVIHNWVDLALFDGHQAAATNARFQYDLRDKFVVGFVGRLSHAKGALDFVRLASAFVARLPQTPVAFVMVGDGPMRPFLEAEVEERRLAAQFVFTGALDFPAALIHVMDVGVICSPSESFPNVLLEFMACGKPVVATRVGDIGNALEDGRTGLLVPPGAFEALADACVSLATQPETARDMGHAARRAVEARYPMATSVREYIELYEQISERR